MRPHPPLPSGLTLSAPPHLDFPRLRLIALHITSHISPSPILHPIRSAYSVDMTDFAEKMLKFVTFVETNEELGTNHQPPTNLFFRSLALSCRSAGCEKRARPRLVTLAKIPLAYSIPTRSGAVNSDHSQIFWKDHESHITRGEPNGTRLSLFRLTPARASFPNRHPIAYCTASLQMERCGREFSEPLAQFIENDFIATAVRPRLLMFCVVALLLTLVHSTGSEKESGQGYVRVREHTGQRQGRNHETQRHRPVTTDRGAPF